MGKKIAPIIITVIAIGLVSLYLLGFFFALIFTESFALFFILGIFVIIGIMIAIIYTLVERLKEIDKEDKDDLSKY
jgi:pilus assembly protein TadC